MENETFYPDTTETGVETVTMSVSDNGTVTSHTDSFGYLYSASTTPAVMVIYLGIGTLGIIGNLLVTVVMLKYEKLRIKLTNTFIINQSAIDFVTACILVVTQATDDIS